MHEHDLDLIAALAEGSLDDESEARALVESCDVCSSEFRAQTEVLALLDATPPAAMTELEKAALHRDLWAELRREPARTASAPWWQRWSYVAAGLFVLVGLVTVLDGLQGGEKAETFSDISSDLASAPTSEEGAPFSAADRATEGAGDEQQVTTTTAAEAASSIPFADLADAARAQDGTDSRIETSSVDETIEECLHRLGLDEHVVVDEIELDQTYLVVMAEEDRDGTVTFVSRADCEIVYVDR